MLTLLLSILAPGSDQIKPLPAPGLRAEAAAPFSYYLVPSDEIGFKDCPQAFQITFDGAINNGFGELDLATGTPPRPVNHRLKTLADGYLPIVDYDFDLDGAHFAVEAFAAPYNLDPMEDLVAFERVTVTNPTAKTVHTELRAAFNPRGEVSRSDLRCRKWYEAKFAAPAPVDAPNPSEDRILARPGGLVFKDNRFAFSYSGAPVADSGSATVQYRIDLAAGGHETIDFQMPFVPVDRSRGEEVAKLFGMSFDSMRRRVVDFWTDIYHRALQIDVDDPKVVDTMRSSLTYDLMARDIEADGKHFTQTVNKFQYHAFFARDTSFIARSYELLNLPDVARTTIEKYLVRDKAGKVVRFLRTSPDDWGQSLWAVGSYFRSTGDVGFAKEVDSAIPPHLDEFEKRVASDPLGLWPVAGPYDNELINGHYTSHNLWALLGLREAENLARAAGDTASAARAKALYAGFYHVFVTRLGALTAKDDGYIPPGMDDPLAGYDWENASGGVYPFHVFKADNPWVTATIRMEREYKYREGIMTWGPNAWVGKVAAQTGKPYDPLYLHDYDTFQVAETELARGEQQAVIEDLYSTLVHTSSTNGGFETSIRPWGDRDPSDNFPPHGWFAARYNELVRNMLLREDEDKLVLCSALAPQWVRPGKTVRVVNGANRFGSLDFALACARGGATLELDSHWRTAPRSLVLHVPWFLQVTRATADGHPAQVISGAIRLPADARRVDLTWRWVDHPDLSYARAVQLWLRKNYEPKPGEDTDHLFPTRTRPSFADTKTAFIHDTTLRLASRSGEGVIHFTMDGTTATAASPRYRHPAHVSESTVVHAVEVYADGTASDPITARLVKLVPTAAVPVPGALPGIAYAYYEGSFDKMPTFSSLRPARAGVAAEPDLDDIAHRSELFAVTAEGLVKAPADGLYTFATGSDDGSMMWIDGKLVVDNDGPHPYQEVNAVVALKAGFHWVRIAYFDAGGANYLHVLWQAPGGKRERIPAAAWFHE